MTTPVPGRGYIGLESGRQELAIGRPALTVVEASGQAETHRVNEEYGLDRLHARVASAGSYGIEGKQVLVTRAY